MFDVITHRSRRLVESGESKFEFEYLGEFKLHPIQNSLSPQSIQEPCKIVFYVFQFSLFKGNVELS